jgi:hypothetical protein
LAEDSGPSLRSKSTRILDSDRHSVLVAPFVFDIVPDSELVAGTILSEILLYIGVLCLELSTVGRRIIKVILVEEHHTPEVTIIPEAKSTRTTSGPHVVEPLSFYEL